MPSKKPQHKKKPRSFEVKLRDINREIDVSNASFHLTSSQSVKEQKPLSLLAQMML